MNSGERIPVAIYGATGAVGQRFVQLLDGHATFRVAELFASERSAGRAYGDVCDWRLEGDVPEGARDVVVRSAEESPSDGVRLVMSALDSKVAGPVETRLADDGFLVVSNASAHRMAPRVPLVVPEVNADHLELVRHQGRTNGGGIVCNPNCSTIGLVLALAPLHRAFGIESVHVTTLQAASGAGYPGVSSLDLIDNVVPFIPSEEDKLVEEPAKILGARSGEEIEPASLVVSPQCFRVPVVDGHSASVSVKLGTDVDEDALRGAWTSSAAGSGFREAPIALTDAVDRPQPRLDRGRGEGLTATIGRVRPCQVHDWRFVVLSHNTIRGAAGGAILVAEEALRRGLVPI